MMVGRSCLPPRREGPERTQALGLPGGRGVPAGPSPLGSGRIRAAAADARCTTRPTHPMRTAKTGVTRTDAGPRTRPSPETARAKGGTLTGAAGEGEGAGPGTVAVAVVLAASAPLALTTVPRNISVTGPPWTRSCRRVAPADTAARGDTSTAAAAKSAAMDAAEAMATAMAAAAKGVTFWATAAPHLGLAFRPLAAAVSPPTGRRKGPGVGTIVGTIAAGPCPRKRWGEGGGGARTAPRAGRGRGLNWMASTWRTAGGMTTGAASSIAGLRRTRGSGGAVGTSSLPHGTAPTGAGWCVASWGNFWL